MPPVRGRANAEFGVEPTGAQTARPTASVRGEDPAVGVQPSSAQIAPA